MTQTAPTYPTTSVVHFKPEGGWVGDVIPFEKDGRIWLFYLLEIRDDPTSGTGWALVSTTDFVHYTDHGTVLPSGGPDAEDFNCYTGSLIDDGDTIHLFYTGNNPNILAADDTPQLQQVMHATSEHGLLAWRKHPEHTFAAPPPYDPADWRDPFVYRVAPGQPWRMLLATRHLDGPPRRRGVVAQLISEDLISWTPVEPLWDPRRYVTQECPDVFQQDGWWYLVYSEFSDAFVTRYRIARDPDGPWHAPAYDTVDGRAFYAAKSVSAGGRRFFIGWIATKERQVDDGAWQWAGTMSVLESRSQSDGTLAFFVPPEMIDSFNTTVPVRFAGRDSADRTVRLSALDGYRVVMTQDQLPTTCYAAVAFDIEPHTRECGILLRASADGDTGYIVRLEPHRDRVVFDRWPRRRTGAGQWETSGDVPFMIELERPCPLPAGSHAVELMVDDTTCVVVVDHTVALSARIYDHPAGHLGLFTNDGVATASLDTLTRRPD